MHARVKSKLLSCFNLRERKEKEERRLRGEPESDTDMPDPTATGSDPFKQLNRDELVRKVLINMLIFCPQYCYNLFHVLGMYFSHLFLMVVYAHGIIMLISNV